jgi:hypothetical protein
VPTLAASKISAIGARVYRTTDQSLTHATTSALSFNAERYDTSALHDNVTNNDRLTAPVAGYYLISGTVAFDNNATGTRQVQIEINSTTTIQVTNANTAGFTFLSVTAIYQMAAGDYARLLAYQTSGGALNVRALANYSLEFSMHLLGS